MECTVVSPSGSSATDSFVEERKELRIYEPLEPKEISKITATPASPPPCDDLPSYPCVPFLLHPHRPLLLWWSSSAVHAYDLVNNRWEAGGPQQLQPHLQQLHHLPVAAADCICLECGARSSALRDSSALNKRHTRMRRFLSQCYSCPSCEGLPDRGNLADVPPCSNGGAAAFQGSHAGGAAGKDAAATVANDDAVGAASDHTAASVPLAVASAARRSSAACVWVTAGEDKYLHFVDAGSYKLLRSRLQRKKLSSVVLLRSTTRAPVATSRPSPREHRSAGTSNDSWPHVQEEAVPASCCTRGLTKDLQERPTVQLLVADKFGDVYLLRDCLGAPAEQSLAGDLLCERMRTLPSVRGVRVCDASAAGPSVSIGASGTPGTVAATRESAASGGAAVAASPADDEPSAAGDSATAAMKCSCARAASAGAQLSAAYTVGGRQITNQPTRVRRQTGPQASCLPVSGQETDSGASTTAVGGRVATAGDGPAGAGTAPVSEQQGTRDEDAHEVESSETGAAVRAEGDDISNPLLHGPSGADGETGNREGKLGGSTEVAFARHRVVNQALRSETVTSLRLAAPSTGDPVCGGSSTEDSTPVTTAKIPGANLESTDVRLVDVIDVQQVDAATQQPGADGLAAGQRKAEERGIPAEFLTHRKSEWQKQPNEEQQQGRQQTRQQMGQRGWVLKQHGEGEKDQLNTREQRFQNNAWQRERARLWRQQHLFTTVSPTRHLQQGGSDCYLTAGAGRHRETKDDANEYSCADDFADIPLLSHLTTITVMKVFPECSLPLCTFKDTSVAAASVPFERGVGTVSEHTGYAPIETGAGTSREECAAALTETASTFLDGRRVSSALCSSRCGAACDCLHVSPPETVSEEAVGCVSQLHLSSNGLSGADLLLTADRDEKVRVCFLEQPWSIESFYLGQSEFVVDCVLIANGCVRDQTEDNPLCGSWKNRIIREDILLAQAEEKSGSGTAHICQPTPNDGSVVGTSVHQSCGCSEIAGIACLFESAVDKKLHLRQKALLGKLGISAAADGTLQVWRVSDGAQIDELLLMPNVLFDSRDLPRVLSCCEEASPAAPPTGSGTPCSPAASRIAINRGGEDLCSTHAGEQLTISCVPPPVISHRPLFPSSLLFDEDQRLLVVQCLKLRGLLLIPVEWREPVVCVPSQVRCRNPLLRRHPFFIPLPVVPVAVLLVYHSLEELKQIPALAQAARALRPLLSPSTGTHVNETRSSKQDLHRPHSGCSRGSTSSDSRGLTEHSLSLAATNHADGREFCTVSEAIPFVWWVDEKGRLRPPVCVSVLLLQREQQSHPQQELERAEAGTTGEHSPVPFTSQILPCLEGCSSDAFGADYGIKCVVWLYQTAVPRYLKEWHVDWSAPHASLQRMRAGTRDQKALSPTSALTALPLFSSLCDFLSDRSWCVHQLRVFLEAHEKLHVSHTSRACRKEAASQASAAAAAVARVDSPEASPVLRQSRRQHVEAVSSAPDRHESSRRRSLHAGQEHP